MALFFTLLDALLLARYHDDIPVRDCVVWAAVLILLLFLVKLEWRGYPVRRIPLAEFHRKSRPLEFLVVVGSFLVPWFILASGSAVHTKKAGFLLAPHLFVLQAHIAGEGIIETGGDKDWLMFAYTCLANAYRIFPLTLWVRRLLLIVPDENDEMIQQWLYGDIIMMLLPAYAILVWLYWSFWYLPIVWYPLLEKRPKES